MRINAIVLARRRAAWPRATAFATAFAAAFAALCLAASFFPGQALAGKPKFEQVALTKDSVKRLIASYPRIRGLALTQALARGKDLTQSKNPIQAVIKFASDDTVRAEADVTVKEFGFKDFDEWISVAFSTAVAYARVKAGGDGDKADKIAEKAVSKIEEFDLLSEKQKRKIRERMAEGGSLRPLPENVSLVKAMEKDIDAVVKK